ncbi:MAG: hypothetical protein NWT08_04735 [Akkermansiaceae bacterium]|nr:hypothetical protein [Akkermansiaceae bacterium]
MRTPINGSQLDGRADEVDASPKQMVEDASTDPFADDPTDLTEHPHGFTEMDMADPIQRDIVISLWYTDMYSVVQNIELHTGHKFNKEVYKLHASPMEILEEQAEFMETFLKETRRIAAERNSNTETEDKKIPNKAEMATPNQPSD